jgi:hypothetical protein
LFFFKERREFWRRRFVGASALVESQPQTVERKEELGVCVLVVREGTGVSLGRVVNWVENERLGPVGGCIPIESATLLENSYFFFFFEFNIITK